MATIDQKSFTPDTRSPDTTIQFISQSSSPSRSRYKAGLEKLQVNHRNKHLMQEINSVSNKINLIYRLEQQVKQKLQEDRFKAETVLEKKARNELKQREKDYFNHIKKKEEEDLRSKIKEEKKKRVETIKAMKESIYKEKLEIVKEAKKNREELDSMGRSYKELLRQQKSILKSNRLKEVTQNKNKSHTFTLKITEKLKKDYEDRIQNEKQRYLELLQKKQELEKIEALAIERYSSTLVNSGLSPPVDFS
jgi:hypothetical protein